jgi:ribosomal protein S11
LANKKLIFKNKDKKFIGCLYFFKRYSNIFLVLSNYKRKHIITLTSGSCKLGKNKKKKISPFNMLNLVKSLKEHILKNNIKILKFYFKQRFSRHFFNLKKMFKLNEIKIYKYTFLLYKSYNLNKKRKIRRI